MTNPPHILIACIGNIFRGDDGFGVQVAKHLTALPGWPGVRVIDFGIRGLELVYALLEAYDIVIFVDAIPQGGPPGTLYLIEPESAEFSWTAAQDAQLSMTSPLLMDMHDLNPLKLLQLASSMGARFKRIILVGCEPKTLEPAEGALELSAPVESAVREAVPIIDLIVQRLLKEQPSAVAV